MGELDKSASALRKAIRYRPTEFGVTQELAQIYREAGNQEKLPGLWTAGEKACHKSMKDLPDDPAPWLNLGRFLLEQNRNLEAKELYRKIGRRHWPRFRRVTHREAEKMLLQIN